MTRTATRIYTAIAVASLLFSAVNQIACDDLSGCVWWKPDEPDPGRVCSTVEQCGNVRVCIHASCVDGHCVYDNAPVGMACDQCEVIGECNASGECVGNDAGTVATQ